MKRAALFALAVLSACATGGPPTLFAKGIGIPLRDGDALIDCALLGRIAAGDIARRPGAEEACVRPGPEGLQQSLTYYTDKLHEGGFEQRPETSGTPALTFCRGEELVVLSPMMRPLGTGGMASLSENMMRTPIGLIYVPAGPCA